MILYLSFLALLFFSFVLTLLEYRRISIKEIRNREFNLLEPISFVITFVPTVFYFSYNFSNIFLISFWVISIFLRAMSKNISKLNESILFSGFCFIIFTFFIIFNHFTVNLFAILLLMIGYEVLLRPNSFKDSFLKNIVFISLSYKNTPTQFLYLLILIFIIEFYFSLKLKKTVNLKIINLNYLCLRFIQLAVLSLLFLRGYL